MRLTRETQVWPQEVEEVLGNVKLPGADLDLQLEAYARVVCAVMDIPVYNDANSVVQSLHVLFTLYSDDKSS